MMSRISLASLILVTIVITACGALLDSSDTLADPTTGMPNPASQHCAEQGGKLEIRDEADGQVGYCIFPDGSECEEWAFFRDECTPSGTYKPLDPAACRELADAVSETVGAEVSTDQSAFDDFVTGQSGAGCQISAAWTEEDFVSTPAISSALEEMLQAKGWQEDSQYNADGPTSTATAYRLDKRLCLLTVAWEPTQDANCPADQPISSCKLRPEQQLHQVTLNCAQTAVGP